MERAEERGGGQRVSDRVQSSAQWLCGITCLLGSAAVGYFGVLYAIAASYSGGLDNPWAVTLVFSAMGFPMLAILAVAIGAARFRRTRRFTWKAYLFVLGYLVALATLAELAVK